MSNTTINPAKVFYSYAHKDEEFKDELETHLSQMKREGLIIEWHDRKIGAGMEWANSINEHLGVPSAGRRAFEKKVCIGR